jgi:hypothetical protein
MNLLLPQLASFRTSTRPPIDVPGIAAHRIPDHISEHTTARSCELGAAWLSVTADTEGGIRTSGTSPMQTALQGPQTFTETSWTLRE